MNNKCQCVSINFTEAVIQQQFHFKILRHVTGSLREVGTELGSNLPMGGNILV